MAWTANPQLKRIMSSGTVGRMKIKFLSDDGNTWKATHLYCKLTLNTWCWQDTIAWQSLTFCLCKWKKKKIHLDWRLHETVYQTWACMLIRKKFSDINCLSCEFWAQNTDIYWIFSFISKRGLQCYTDILLCYCVVIFSNCHLFE